MNKYRAKPTVIDGIRFASQKEARRYCALKLMENVGDISRLEIQPRFECWVNGVKVCTYIADFAYFRGQERVIEDVKSGPTKTPVYRLKRKLVEALYPNIKITEV